MPETRNLVDVERLLVVHYRADADLVELVGARVSTELPGSFDGDERLKLSRVGGSELDTDTAYLDRALVQLDAYGTTKLAAFAVAATSLAATYRARGSHAGAVVSRVERVSGPAWAPDPETDFPRYLTTVAVTVHPTA